MSKITYKKYNDLLNKISQLENLSKKNTTEITDIVSPSVSRVYRTQTDIAKLRLALDTAESIVQPTYFNLQQIYNEVVLDSEVTSVIQKRKNYVIARDYSLFKDDVENLEAKDFFKNRWVKKFINYTLDAIFYGYSLIRIDAILDDALTGVSLVPRQNTNPKLRRILETPYQVDSGASIDEAKLKDWYILVSDSQDTHYEGLFSKISTYQILLKLAQSAFAEYTERFGSPNVIIKTGNFNEAYINRLDNYASNFNRLGYGIFSNMDEIDLVESSGKSSDIYSALISEMKSNINKVVLGTETLGDEESFVGAANISEGLVNGNSYYDMDFCEDIINDELIPRLVSLGVTFLKGVKFKFNRANKMKAVDEFAMYMQLLQNGLQVDNSVWLEKFNLKGVNQSSTNDLFKKEETDTDVQE